MHGEITSKRFENGYMNKQSKKPQKIVVDHVTVNAKYSDCEYFDLTTQMRLISRMKRLLKKRRQVKLANVVPRQILFAWACKSLEDLKALELTQTHVPHFNAPQS